MALFYDGLRVNEATALRWKQDIDLENRTLTVNYSLRLKNKNDWSLGPTKTRAGLRTIAIDTDTVTILSNWRNKQVEFGNIDFILSYNGAPTRKSTLQESFKDMLN